MVMNLRKKKGTRTSDLRVRKLWSRTLAMILCIFVCAWC